jgi:chemotaxis methyl-accepting protein methylase
MKKGVVSMFANQLAEDGTLFIGHSERIKDLTTDFQQLPIPQGFCYQKSANVTSA